jgi:hypothetical protein
MHTNTIYRTALEAVTAATSLDEAVEAAARALKAEERVITQDMHLRLVGLLSLIEQHYHQIMDCQRAIAALLGAESASHIDDAIWGDESFDAGWLLNKLGITVDTTLHEEADEKDGFAL